jgi:hypothetical protein
MLDSTTIILIVVIVLIIFFIFYGKNNNNKEKFVAPYEPQYRYKYKTNLKDEAKDVIDDVISWESSTDAAVVTKEPINKNFIEIKFHNDYRDVMTALNNLVPDARQRFNLANIPLVYSQPETDEVKLLVKDFLHVLNENIMTDVPSYRNPNSGWDEAIPDPNMKSGWDKIQDSLGLPESLYNDPAKKGPVKLISISLVQKYETDDEIKYAVDMVLQKVNVEDQLLLKASFVQDKRPLYDENNFFVTKNLQLKIVIEDVYILGYLSQYGQDARLQFDNDKEKYYDYNALEYNNLLDPKFVQKILEEKYKQRSEEIGQRNALLDEEGQDFHRTLPNLYDFSNIRGTYTIYDDMNLKKTFV